ncbi:hypothetical protein C9374_012104 [Naegleria lovaniensis]|uniref:Uncharacterized protein n=1 Tax=Naegleria lovaniensis TaxID=51637 RepID=A0AA88GDB8_NAELO|nr:uncharacterized protein C9374_012104 [Naegleria lovaniensis]KAG2373497.1 hypothetical protein C9374_012104 [Naegleria lovaniensis]
MPNPPRPITFNTIRFTVLFRQEISREIRKGKQTGIISKILNAYKPEKEGDQILQDKSVSKVVTGGFFLDLPINPTTSNIIGEVLKENPFVLFARDMLNGDAVFRAVSVTLRVRDWVQVSGHEIVNVEVDDPYISGEVAIPKSIAVVDENGAKENHLKRKLHSKEHKQSDHHVESADVARSCIAGDEQLGCKKRKLSIRDAETDDVGATPPAHQNNVMTDEDVQALRTYIASKKTNGSKITTPIVVSSTTTLADNSLQRDPVQSEKVVGSEQLENKVKRDSIQEPLPEDQHRLIFAQKSNDGISNRPSTELQNIPQQHQAEHLFSPLHYENQTHLAIFYRLTQHLDMTINKPTPRNRHLTITFKINPLPNASALFQRMAKTLDIGDSAFTQLSQMESRPIVVTEYIGEHLDISTFKACKITSDDGMPLLAIVIKKHVDDSALADDEIMIL